MALRIEQAPPPTVRRFKIKVDHNNVTVDFGRGVPLVEARERILQAVEACLPAPEQMT